MTQTPYGKILGTKANGGLKAVLVDDDGALITSEGEAAADGIGATDDAAVINGGNGSLVALMKGLQNLQRGSYELVAASQTDQVLGAAGAAGDLLERLIIVPATDAPGLVHLQDADGTAFPVYVGGASQPLIPIVVEVGAVCTGTTTPGWKVTTGANVTVIAIGKFT